MNGEIYDARLEREGWASASYDESTWQPVALEAKADPSRIVDVTARVRELLRGSQPVSALNSLAGRDPIVGVQKSLVVTFSRAGKTETAVTMEPGQWEVPAGVSFESIMSAKYGDNKLKKRMALGALATPPVAREAELKPQAITQPKPGVYVVDFGQNFAGWARLQVNGKVGQTIYLRFAEDLNPDGTIYTDNLRSVNLANRYICRGGKVETWEPRFTYHGFRYIQITGLSAPPTPETLTGIVAHSGGPITSTFDSSSAMLNRLYQNVQWSQRSNYFETMTDCPQRDERYGWTGDAWFFMASST